MKIYINKYRDHWLSPYTIIDYIFFWKPWSKCSRNKSIQAAYDEYHGISKYVPHPAWVERVAEVLNPACELLQKILNKIHPKIDYIKIDRWDTWSMDSTLAQIALPMLKQLRDTKHGSPFVDDEDVPEELRSTNAPPKEHEWDWDNNNTARWEWVLNEMIFAFEHQVNDDWEEEFRKGEIDLLWIPVDRKGNRVPEEEAKLYQMERGPNDTFKCDYDGIKAVYKRQDNGFRLFGKYYRGLWD